MQVTDAKRRQRRKDDRPAEITRAAQAAFVENGFAAARMDDIAARAGVSKGLIYAYFPTKVALFESVLRANIVPVLSNIAEAVRADIQTPAREHIRLVVETVYRELVLTERRRLLHLVIAEGVRFPEITAYYYSEVITKGRDLMSSIIERGISRGEFARRGMEVYPEIIMAPALLAVLWSLLLADAAPVEMDKFMDVHVDLVLRALQL